MTRVLKSVSELQNFRKDSLEKKLSLGLVPTMGALHEGHFSLVKKSLEENDLTVVSIFVNPTQFNKKEDLTHYPRTFERDLKNLQKRKVDCVFAPSSSEIYPLNYRFKVVEESESLKLCGQDRPGHFNGVLSIILKLLNITQADHAYFGAKDFQQLQLIQDMCKSFFIPTKIIGCSTQRTSSGLALSSRNERLSPAALEKASYLYHYLSQKKLQLPEIHKELTKKGFKIDYLEEYSGRRFVAASLEGIRLIDNVDPQELRP